MSVPASQTGTIMRQGNFTRTRISGTRRNGARKRKRWIGSGDSILLLTDSGSLSEQKWRPQLKQKAPHVRLDAKGGIFGHVAILEDKPMPDGSRGITVKPAVGFTFD